MLRAVPTTTATTATGPALPHAAAGTAVRADTGSSSTVIGWD
ncbi:hypothetical protein ACGF0D_18300 [Kitasatospora sp. NPDC048298]